MIALIALSLAGAQAASAAVPPVAPASPAVPAPDPARLAAARPVIDAIWPTGTYGRIMRTAMEQVSGTMMPTLLGLKPGAAAPAGDPHFQERFDITMRVMGEEMSKLMTELEPGIREALAASYARRFTVAELRDLDAFFRTPTGRAYAADSMLLMMSPDMMRQMTAAMPRMIAAMPAIMAKVDAATSHLPPPPDRKTDR